MRVEVESSVVTLRIFDAPKLDPITVVLRDIEPGRGEMIVACYGLAWVGYWSAIGDRTLREFMVKCHADYIANRIWIQHERRVKHRYAYLVRIIEAVQSALIASPELES